MPEFLDQHTKEWQKLAKEVKEEVISVNFINPIHLINIVCIKIPCFLYTAQFRLLKI